MAERPFQIGPWLENALFRSVIGVLRLLPYERRLAAMAWACRHVIGPAVGYRRRALANLALIYPEKSHRARRALADAVLETLGRTVMENYSHDEFRARIAEHDIEGPGLAAAEAAMAEGRAIIFTSGHWGNHEATRVALDQRGFKVGGLYKPMANPYFNAHYVESIAQVSGPVFPKGKEGTKDFLRFLSKGGHGFLLHDVFFHRGEWMSFLGQPAKTALSAAELALKFDAVLIPYFNTRLAEDPTRFRIELLAPVPHGAPREMTRTLMDLLEEKIASDPGQWMWIHRRWKWRERAPQP
ncbi:MAG: lauroyl acyltransferase [Pseudomonadota bacterium]